MKKVLVILMLVFAINLANAATTTAFISGNFISVNDIPSRERIKFYRSTKHRKKMQRRSKRAMDRICKRQKRTRKNVTKTNY